MVDIWMFLISKVNGYQTLEENLADNEGLQMAFNVIDKRIKYLDPNSWVLIAWGSCNKS